MASERRFTPGSRRQSATTKPVEYEGPQFMDDEAFEKIERELSLESPDLRLRKSLSSCVFDYAWACQHTPAGEAAVRNRLTAVKRAASELCKNLTEDPTRAAATAAIRAAIDERFKKRPNNKLPGAEVASAIQELHEKLTDDAVKTVVWEDYKYLTDDQAPPNNRDLDDQAVRQRVKGLILRKTGIDVDDLAKQLDRLCTIDTHEKSKGGRPGFKHWNILMLKLANLYEEATGKQASVTENEHRAGANERYSGSFLRVAAIVDHETASAMAFIGVRPRPNSALGPALRRVLASRRTRGPSKTT
jgi:hypothetical protein